MCDPQVVMACLFGCVTFLAQSLVGVDQPAGTRGVAVDAPVVADFVISLPGGGKIRRTGASEIPGGRLLLTHDFKVPKPSTVVLPAGTVVEQIGGAGWQNLVITGPDHVRLAFSSEEFSGCVLSPEIDWSSIQVEKIPPLSPAAQSLVRQLEDERADINRFLALMQATSGLTPFDARRVLVEYVKFQRPDLGTDDIKSLYKELRSSIHSISYSSETKYESVDSSLKKLRRPRIQNWVFKSHDNKVFAESTTLASDNDRRNLFRYSFTTEFELEFIDVPGMRRGTRQVFRGRSRYYPEDHIFRTSMLIDGPRDIGTDVENSSLVDTEFSVLAQQIDWNGTPVVPCVTLNFRVFYLDPARGYALVADENRYRFDEALGKLVASDDQYVMNVVEHQEVGNGLWLPKEVFAVWREGEKEILNRRTRYSEVKVNSAIPASEFDDIIPDGVMTVDTTSGRGQPVPLPQTLPAPSTSLRWLLWCNAVIFAVVVIMISRRRTTP